MSEQLYMNDYIELKPMYRMAWTVEMGNVQNKSMNKTFCVYIISDFQIIEFLSLFWIPSCKLVLLEITELFLESY